MICKSFAALLAIVTVVTTSIALPSAANEVRFTSDAGKPSAFREKLARQRGETLPPYQGIPLVGFLSRPKGDGPFPAIVILHGCGGGRGSRMMFLGGWFPRVTWSSLLTASQRDK